MILVLSIMSLSVALILPRISTLIDQAQAHTVFFDFQRQVLDLHRDAFHSETALSVVSSGNFIDDPQADPVPAEVRLRTPWSYRLDQPMTIDSGGNCSAVTVELIKAGRPVVRLEGHGADCRFSRVFT